VGFRALAAQGRRICLSQRQGRFKRIKEKKKRALAAPGRRICLNEDVYMLPLAAC